MAKIINGDKISKDIISKLKEEIAVLKEKYKKTPGLAVILIGNNPASEVYVNIKRKRCEEIGINFSIYKFQENIEEKKIIKVIKKLNKKKDINGIIVQLPLPKGFNEREILNAIDINKDVDGLTTENLGKLFIGNPNYIPCTPQGIIYLLKYEKINLEGKKAVIIGRSNIVGKPLAFLLLQENCTVTICHSKTKNLFEETKQADILVTAIGKPNFVKGKFIKNKAVVIDVGINRIPDEKSKSGYKLVGDVDFKTASKKASFITPVPGGVGPMTVAMLLKNTVESFKRTLL
jgi:methylenetetrahydrofolate dehydrogenase (NADP+)/methenyltetrahydrofolate cyclohydrolase